MPEFTIPRESLIRLDTSALVFTLRHRRDHGDRLRSGPGASDREEGSDEPAARRRQGHRRRIPWRTSEQRARDRRDRVVARAAELRRLADAQLHQAADAGTRARSRECPRHAHPGRYRPPQDRSRPGAVPVAGAPADSQCAGRHRRFHHDRLAGVRRLRQRLRRRGGRARGSVAGRRRDLQRRLLQDARRSRCCADATSRRTM